MTVEKFIEQLAVDGIILSQVQLAQFESYVHLLIEWNEVMNLTAITSFEEIYEKHFYDSVLPFIDYPPSGSLCDVGSGAGFPGIVLKIIYPDLHVVLLEPLKKRTNFLMTVITELKLKDIEVINQRAEDYVKLKREQFDWVTARAVANLAILAELCLPLVKVDGYFMALKGSNAEIEFQQAKKAVTILGAKLNNLSNKALNQEIIRNNLLFQKINKTPTKYPRNYAQIKNKPL